MASKNDLIRIIANNIDFKGTCEYLIDNDDLTKLGLNSISFVKIVVQVEKMFNVKFEYGYLNHNKFSSLNVLYDYIKKL